MAQQQSPWLEGSYGWNYGESGWNTGMDQNLLKFSFLFDGNVDSIVASLPAVVNGQAHFLSTDNRFYFATGGIWYSSPCPKWFQFKIKSTGATYQFNGTSALLVDNVSQIDARLDAVELTVSTLGSAAFEDVSSFATQAELDIVEGQSQGYTDTLRQDLADATDPAKGAGMVGYARQPLSQIIKTVGQGLDANAATPWEYANLVTVRPNPEDPATWDWTAALNALFAQNRHVFLPPGDYRITASVFIPSNTTVQGTRASKILMTENPDGHNLVCVKDSENVTVQGFSIVGVSGAGTSFPIYGVVDGQGVCFAAYGSANVQVLDMYSKRNGNGSGNFYFATCRDSRMVANHVELSSNAYCVDNYYDPPVGAPCQSHSRNIVINGNTARDLGGRGLAIDCADSPEKDDGFVVTGNIIDAAAWAGLQINAYGALVANNVVRGRRDLGRSTMGGQQSQQTYYGFYSDIGGQNTSIINNQFLDIYKNGISVLRQKDLVVSGNVIKMGTSFANQNNGFVVENIADVTDSALYRPIFVTTDAATPRGLGKLRITDNVILSERNHGTRAKAPNLIAVNNSAANVAMLDGTEIEISGNDMLGVPDADRAIYYFQVTGSKNAVISISRNKARFTQGYSRGILVNTAKSLKLLGNEIHGADACVTIATADLLVSEANTWGSSAVAFNLEVANAAGQIGSFVCADTFVGITSWCFSAPQANGSAVPLSDASRCTFISCPMGAIKNAAFPRNLRGLYSAAAPSAGFWEARDRVGVSAPTTWAEWICTVAGTPGTWKLTSQISG